VAAAVQELLNYLHPDASTTISAASSPHSPAAAGGAEYDSAVARAVSLLFGKSSPVEEPLPSSPVEKKLSTTAVMSVHARPARRQHSVVDEEFAGAESHSLAEAYERSLERSNALASAQIRSLLEQEAQVALALQPFHHLDHDNDALLSEESHHSLDPAPPASHHLPTAHGSPPKVLLDGSALSASATQRPLPGAVRAVKPKPAALTAERRGPDERDVADIVLVGSKPPPATVDTAMHNVAGTPFAVARTLQKSGSSAPLPSEPRPVAMSLEEYRKSRQPSRTVVPSYRIDPAAIPTTDSQFLVSDDKLFTMSSEVAVSSSVAVERPRRDGLVTPLSPPTVTHYSPDDFPLNPNHLDDDEDEDDSEGEQVLQVPRDWVASAPIVGLQVRRRPRRMDDDEVDEEEMEQELRAALEQGRRQQEVVDSYRQAVVEGLRLVHGNGVPTNPEKAASFYAGGHAGRGKGTRARPKAGDAGKNVFCNKLLPPLLAGRPDVEVREVGSHLHPDKVQTVYRGLSDVLKSKQAQQALPVKKPARRGSNSSRQYVLDPLHSRGIVFNKDDHSYCRPPRTGEMLIQTNELAHSRDRVELLREDSFAKGAASKSEVTLPSVSTLRRQSLASSASVTHFGNH